MGTYEEEEICYDEDFEKAYNEVLRGDYSNFIKV